jgi:hypothetical protein
MAHLLDTGILLLRESSSSRLHRSRERLNFSTYSDQTDRSASESSLMFAIRLWYSSSLRSRAAGRILKRLGARSIPLSSLLADRSDWAVVDTRAKRIP